MAYLSLVLEQTIISVVNAVYLIALGRVLDAVDFAIVGLGFTIFLFGMAVYDSTISGPIIVLRKGLGEDQESYIALVWYIHLALLVVFGTLSLAIWQLSDGVTTRGVALGFGFLSAASSTIFMRARLHSESDTLLSIRAAIAYAFGFIGSAVLIWFFGYLRPSLAPIPFAVGCASFVCAAYYKIPRWRAAPKRAYIIDHIVYARTSILYSALTNLTTNIYPIIFAFQGNYRDIGGYRLITTTFTPFYQILGAVAAFTIPKLAKHSLWDVERSAITILTATVIAPCVCAGLAIPFGSQVATVLFGSAHVDLGAVAPYAYIAAAISLALQAISLWLRANQKLVELRIAGLSSFVGTLVIAWPFVYLWELEGAFLSLAIANGFALALLLAKLFSRSETSPR